MTLSDGPCRVEMQERPRFFLARASAIMYFRRITSELPLHQHPRTQRMENTHEVASTAKHPASSLSSVRLKDDPPDACVICLSAISERAITVPCNHYTFDFLCLASWLQEQSTCPLCKAELTAIQYDWRSPTDFKTYNVRPKQTQAKPAVTSSAQSLNSRPYRPFRARTTRRPYSPPNPDTTLLRRRHIYKHKLYSLHVGSNRISRYTNLTPQMISTSHDLQARAKMWIRRELRVFSFLEPTSPDPEASSSSNENASTRSAGNAEFLLTYILAILKTVDLKDSSGHAEDMLQEFLGRENTRLFLHELNAWLRSPYTKLEDWDRHVQYKEDLPYGFDEDGRGYGRLKGSRCAERSRSPHARGSANWREREASKRYAPD